MNRSSMGGTRKGWIARLPGLAGWTGSMGACVLWVFLLGIWAAPASTRTGTEVQLLSGVGYKSDSEGPTLLLGAEFSAQTREGSFFTGTQETRIGLHVSDVLAVDTQTNTLTVGVDSSWTRTQGPLSFSLAAQAFYRRKGDASARTVGIEGVGKLGVIHGTLRADYVEGSLGAFPWFQEDLDGLLETEEPLYRVHAGVSAPVIPAYRLNWSHGARFHRPVNEASGVLGVTTGPEFQLGVGRLGAQGGLVFDSHGIEPVWQVRYHLREVESKVDFELVAATRSLLSNRPVVYGWLGVDGESLAFGAAMRLEEDAGGELSPALYFSIHPKF